MFPNIAIDLFLAVAAIPFIYYLIALYSSWNYFRQSTPKQVDLKVERTDPGMKNAAVTNTLKPATMETGLIVQVPHFVNEGDVITINTETHEYAGRGKK